MSSFLNIRSEVGPLQSVMLHRPGKELEWLTPQFLGDLLFDDIPWLIRMQQEHDQFAETLRQHGVTVYYYEELLAEILADISIRESLATDILAFSEVRRDEDRYAVMQYLDEKSAEQVAEIFIAGLHKDQVGKRLRHKNLSYYIKEALPFFINPIPNFYFSRDPGAVIHNGISINSMHSPARKRESMILDYIYRFHPLFKSSELPNWYGCELPDSIEGGDILVLSNQTLAVGCSERTSALAIEILAENLFNSDSGICEILVIQIPFRREYMHLDTVFTMVDRDKFFIFPNIEEKLRVFRLTPARGKSKINIYCQDCLKSALKKSLRLSSIQLIKSGWGDSITAQREQWNDSTNTLAIAPGKVVTYNRNVVSNRILCEHGVEVVEIEGSELVRGRGGPRCMSMPLNRQTIA